MYPGLSDADCQAAAFHYRQLVDEGQRQQFVAGLRPVSVSSRTLPISVRHHLGALLVRAGQRLQGAQAVTSGSFGSVPTHERVAIA